YSRVAAGRGWTLATAILKAKPLTGTVVVPVRGMSVPIAMTMRWRKRDASALISNVAPLLRRASTEGNGRRTPARRQTTRAEPPRSVPLGLQLRHLRALILVAERRSVSRAAEDLGLTQSGVSRQIRALERELGFPLLQRDSRGVVPTAAGEVLRREAQAALVLVDEAIAQTRLSVRGVAGRCRIASV